LAASIPKIPLCVIDERRPDGGVSTTPLFVKDTLPKGSPRVSIAGPIHVHPSGRFVYVTNRGPSTKGGHDSSNSDIAVFAIDQRTGEPNLIQNIDSDGVHPRTFSIDTRFDR
jgi:6-phosphogluconolactonase